MNRKLLMATGAIALALVSVAVAQQPSRPTATPTAVYYVQPGDNLYNLAKLRLTNPERWHSLVEQNPFLQDPRRVYPLAKGGVDIRINPGDPIIGLQPDEVALIGSQAPAGGQVIEVRGRGDQAQAGSNFFTHTWGWLALLLAAIIGLGLYLYRRRRNYRDPVGAGEPVVRGGLTDSSALQHFERRSVDQEFTIRSIERGRGYGEMMVAYRGGREERRLLNGETVYLATVRFEGRDADEQIYMLQGCGNDVRYGNRNRAGREFRFVADAVVHQAPEPAPAVAEVVAEATPAPEPEPEPVPAPVAEEPAPAPVAAAEPPAETLAAKGAERAPTLTIELRPPEAGKDTSVLRVKGASSESLSVTVYDDGVTIRYKPSGKPIAEPAAAESESA